MNPVENVTAASEKLKSAPATQKVLVGFDGFIDEIIHLVDERQDKDNFTRIEKMSDLAKRIDQAAGKSCNIEMVPAQVKLGGNGPIMANALVSQGFEIDYLGALGESEINPVFQEFVEQCNNVISFSEPGHTDALEFFDGKIMMGKHQPLKNVNWDNLTKVISTEEIAKLLNESQMAACVNWTMLPLMNTIFRGFIGLLEQVENRIKIFIDLTDPRKRTSEDILEALDLLKVMQANADVVLGLNEEESMQVAEVLGLSTDSDLEKRAVAIRNHLNLFIVVIHPVSGASVATESGSATMAGPYTSEPKLTTGAGDNFNAGFCNGLLSGLSAQEALASGVCTSGFYVRNCRSPKRQELIDFMDAWVTAQCGDI